MSSDLPLPPKSAGIENPILVGTGGMGVVYRATWRGRTVAVKLPVQADPIALRRFLREQRALSKLRHPYLVRVFDVGGPPKHAVPYIVMEYMSGGSLRQCMSQFCQPWAAARLVHSLADAITYLSDRGYVHRDIKPENVLFDATGRPKLSDFGLVRNLDLAFSRVTVSGQQLGTEEYAAPEQLADATRAEYPADIYSLGVLLHELITGVRPSPCGPPTYRSLVWRPELEGGIGQIILGCVQGEPSRRYTAKLLLRVLSSYVCGEFPRRPPLPHPAYPKVPLGRLTLNITRIVGGDGRTKYMYPDGIVCQSLPTTYSVPEDVRRVTGEWLADEAETSWERRIPFEDRPQPRIDDFGPGMTDDESEQLWPMFLTLSRTNYFATQATNRCIDFLLPDGRSIREVYAGSPDDFSQSNLANPLAINLSVVTSDNHIYVSQRGKYVGVNRVLDANDPARVPAVSGTGHPDIDKTEGIFDPFKAAIREATEEVLGAYELKPDDITFFGLARTTGFFFPFLFGEARIRLTAREYESQPSQHTNDVIGKWGRPFMIEEVVRWMKELYDQFDETGNRRSLSHTAIYSLYQSLIYQFPEQKGRIIQLLNEP